MKCNIIALFSFICFFQTGLFANPVKNNFKIEVTVSDEKSGYLLLKNLTRPLPDTLKIIDGVARFDGYTVEPTPHILADEANKYQLFFIGPNDKIKVTLKKKEMVVTFLEGSPSHEIFRGLIVVQEPLQQIGGSLQEAY